MTEINLGFLFGYTSEEIDNILDEAEQWLNNNFTGC